MTAPPTVALEAFATYVRVGSIEARPWTEDDERHWMLSNIFERSWCSVSQPDSLLTTRVGGMIARNPMDHTDNWYIAPDYFAKHYAPLATPKPVECESMTLREGIDRLRDITRTMPTPTPDDEYTLADNHYMYC